MIDMAIDRLVAAYEVAGLAPIKPAGDVEPILGLIREAIAPLRLPDELQRFYRRVDPESISVAPYPRPSSAEFALSGWEMHKDQWPGMTPKLLFPVCYETHSFMFTELEDGRGSGSVCFTWSYAGSPFFVRFPTFSAYVELLATMIELGEFTRRQWEAHSWIDFDPEGRWDDAVSVRLAGSPPIHGVSLVREVAEDVRLWPEHWLAAEGLAPEDRGPQGADTTVATLLHQAEGGVGGRGTIRATVVSLASTGAGSRIKVDDGTGVLDVWCPAAVCTYGPTVRREFEFDVIVEPFPAPPPNWDPERRMIQERALAYDFWGAAAAVADFHAKAFESKATAEATAIRPID